MDKAYLDIRPKSPIRADGSGHDSNTTLLMAIHQPDSRALLILSKSLLFAVVLLTLLSIYSLTKRTSSHITLYDHHDSDNDGFKILPILLRNLMEEGLIKKGQTGLILGAEQDQLESNLDFLKDAGIALVAGADFPKHEAFDFVFVPSFGRMGLADGLAQDNGLVISPLGQDPPSRLRMLSNYRIVYLRRFESAVVAMRKRKKSPLCGPTSEEKREALKGLEEVYLEPPARVAGAGPEARKMKFLPELLRGSLDEYPRRVFVSDEPGAVEWFYKNYPIGDQEFEVYGVEERVEGKVRIEDFVVMKAEAGVVEEMLREGTLCLVDELFLECRNQWVDGAGEKRAYWECLSLYGKVRDEGIAVHQWWD